MPAAIPSMISTSLSFPEMLSIMRRLFQACLFKKHSFLNVEEFPKVDGFVKLSSIRNSLVLPASSLFASSLG
jgi:hypothetical protein